MRHVTLDHVVERVDPREQRRPRPAGRRAALTSLAVIETVLVCWVLRAGQPVNIDTLNSHVYVLWSLTHHQQDFAWGPGGPGSYLPTTWNLPWWFLTNHLPGIPVAVYLASLSAACVWLVWLVGWELATRLGSRAPGVPAALGAACAALSAMFLVEVGTTFGDVATAPLVLLGVLLVVRAPTRRGAVVLAGLVTGAAFGLKLTNGPYALGLLALTVVVCRPRLRNAGWCTIGLVVGAVATGGWWWLKMLDRFGNPLFPFLAAAVPSPYGPDANVADHRWSLSPLGVLTMPWTMAAHGYPTETPFRDARWLVLVVLLCIGAVGRLIRPSSTAGALLDHPLTGPVVYLGVSFVAWGLAFGYGRYLLPADLLVGAVLAVMAWQLAARSPAHQAMAGSALALALLLGLETHAPFTTTWDQTWTKVALPPLARQADEVIVLPGNDGLSYVVASAPSDARIVQAPSVFGVTPEAAVRGSRSTGREDTEIRALIENHRGPIVAVMSADEVRRGADVALSYGLTQQDGACEPFLVHVAHLSAEQMDVRGVGAAGAPTIAFWGRTAMVCSWTRT